MRILLILLLVFPLSPQAALLAGGFTHSLAVYAANGGNVVAWGDNAYGQLGDGTNTNTTFVLDVFGLTKVTGVAAGDGFSLALDSGGYVWAWGKNDQGQIGDTTTTARNTPVRVSRLSNMVQIAAGKDFGLAVKSDGTVWGWGSNIRGQLGVVVTDDTKYFSSPVQISAGSLGNVRKVAAGTDFSLALKSDGTVWAWGANNSGQLGVGSTIDSITPLPVSLPGDVVIADLVARNHTLALQNNGVIWAWGNNDKGQLGDDTTTMRNAPVQVVDISDARAIAVADSWSLVLRNDGSVWGWGDNDNGQLLDKTKTQRHYPVKAQGLADVVSLAAGPTFAVVGYYQGDVLAWGANAGGQLGSGNTNDNYSAAAAVKKTADVALVLHAADSPSVIATAKTSGTVISLTLSAVITPTDADMGRTGFPLIWADIPKLGNFYLTVFGWFSSGTPIPYSGLATLKSIEIPVLKNFNVSAYPGAKIYAAYGFTPGVAPAAARTTQVYAVP